MKKHSVFSRRQISAKKFPKIVFVRSNLSSQFALERPQLSFAQFLTYSLSFCKRPILFGRKELIGSLCFEPREALELMS